MLQDNNLRQEIIHKIETLPFEKLKEVDKLINEISKPESKKSKLLKFAGSWKEMNNDDFKALSMDLKKRRKNNNRRNRII
jgi:hypothetical protein